MSTLESTGSGGPVEAAEPATGERISPPAKPLLTPFMGVINFAQVAVTLGFSVVLLPNQLTIIDEPNKVANLALITSISLILAPFAQPIVGALSDRTRSRWGRRVPWMLAGGLMMAVSMTGMGIVQSVALIVVLATLLQLGTAILTAPMSALLADRYAADNRGLVSAFIGLGLNVGYAVAVLIAGALAADLPVAYASFGLGFALVLFAFLWVARDSSSKAMQVEPFHWGQFIRSFWINPVQHPDFAWAFAARSLYILAYFVVFGYQFYVLTDFIKLSLDEANVQIGILGLATLAPVVAAGYLAGWVSDRFGKRKLMLYLACVIMALGYVAQLVWPNLFGQYVMAILTNIGFGLYITSDYVVMTQVLPNEEGAAAKDLGILNLATFIPQALSALLAAFVINSLGGYVGLFIVGIVLSILGGLSVIPIRKVT